jgi:hypothetical protein
VIWVAITLHAAGLLSLISWAWGSWVDRDRTPVDLDAVPWLDRDGYPHGGSAERT